MYKKKKVKIIVIGAGSFGTSIATALCTNCANEVVLWTHLPAEAKEIIKTGINERYFPNRLLDPKLQISYDKNVLKEAELVFLAIPSGVIIDFVKDYVNYFNNEAILINLSKGLYFGGKIIPEKIKEFCHNPIVSLKGPSFASEVMNNVPTIFTLGFSKRIQAMKVSNAFENTNLFLDYTTDIKGVEILSVIKNIYAIFLGVIDAKFNSPNTRFMMLTKAFNEMRFIAEALGSRKDTVFLSCGFGDLGLTALNDLSRNRTLGLLIGKGFYNENTAQNTVVLEGINAVKIIYELLTEDKKLYTPFLCEIYNYFSCKNIQDFKVNFRKLINVRMKTILTYGTFDLLHYGHVEILRRSRELGDRLIVGLSTDEFNQIKGKKCVFDYHKRKEMLEALEYVDEVIPEKNWEQKISDVKEHQVDLFVMGDDWDGKFDFLKEFCEVFYLPRTKGVSTSKLKSIL